MAIIAQISDVVKGPLAVKSIINENKQISYFIGYKLTNIRKNISFRVNNNVTDKSNVNTPPIIYAFLFVVMYYFLYNIMQILSDNFKPCQLRKSVIDERKLKFSRF